MAAGVTDRLWLINELLVCPQRAGRGTTAQFGQRKSTEGGYGKMDKVARLFVKVRGFHRGQTMAEYALILTAVAVVVFAGYQVLGTTITSLLSSVDPLL